MKIPSSSRLGLIHDFTINKITKTVKCTCESFCTRGFCHHTRDFKKLTSKLLYGEDFVAKVINNFNNCYDFVSELCQVYPECIGNYDKLDFYSEQVLGSVGKHYRTETIHRSYRRLVENGEIVEPESDRIRKEETERIMHDINQWSPDHASFGDYNQTKLIGEEM